MDKKTDTTTHTSAPGDSQPVQLIPTTSNTRSQKISPLAGIFLAVAAGLLAIGMTAGITAWLVRADLMKNGLQQELQITQQPVSPGVAVVEKVADSVVSITTQTAQYDWFGRQGIASGAGSGVVVTADGYILTNNHVIDGADSVFVTTTNDEQYEAKVVATQPEVDLALIKITDEDVQLEPAEMGSSDDLQVGEDVYAVGNALGQYPNSVTKGIVSGLGRPITAVSSGLRGDLQEFENLIQTDAAINSGNSGGPLVNTEGQVVGINTAVAGQAQNIGFSVPIDKARELLEEAKG